MKDERYRSRIDWLALNGKSAAFASHSPFLGSPKSFSLIFLIGPKLIIQMSIRDL